MAEEAPALLITGSYDHTLKYWDAFKEESVKYFDYGSEHIINRIEISNDKTLIGAACTHSVRLYDPNGKNEQQIYDGLSNVTSVGFQKDNKWIYASSEDGTIHIFDKLQKGYARKYNNKEAINSVVLHPNEGELIAGDQTGKIHIYDLVMNKCRAKLTPAPDIGIRSLSIALNASYLVAADSAGYCHLMTLKNGEELLGTQKFQAHEDYILKCLLSPDVKYLATCSADKTIKIWSLSEKNKDSDKIQEKEQYSHFKTLYGHHKWVWDCAFSCDSQLLVTCSSDAVAKIWNVETGEVIRNFTGHSRGINCLALNDKLGVNSN